MTDLPADRRSSLLECNCTLVRRASRHLTRLYDREFASTGLRTTQLVMLALLAEGTCSSIPDLAQVLVMDRSTVGHNLRPLEKAGLIALLPGQVDRRTRTIAVTETGAAKLKVAFELWDVAQAKFHAEFGSEDAARMRAMMMDVVGLTFGARD